MSVPTITINMDIKCAECGKGGAAESGICMSCTLKAMRDKPMKSAIGRAVQARNKQQLQQIVAKLNTDLGRAKR